MESDQKAAPEDEKVVFADFGKDLNANELVTRISHRKDLRGVIVICLLDDTDETDEAVLVEDKEEARKYTISVAGMSNYNMLVVARLLDNFCDSMLF